MCDYSLMMIPNRLAVEGEELVAHRFPNGSTGLVSCCAYDCWATRPRRSWWRRLRDAFLSEGEPTPVVCIPPGAQLQLNRLPETLKAHVPAPSGEDAVFTQLSAEAGQYRDALRFANGVTVLLQWLPEGQKVKVLRLSSEDMVPVGIGVNSRILREARFRRARQRRENMGSRQVDDKCARRSHITPTS